MSKPILEQAEQARKEFLAEIAKHADALTQLAEGFSQAIAGGAQAIDVLGGQGSPADLFSRAIALSRVRQIRETVPALDDAQAQIECFVEGMLVGVYLCEIGRASLILRKENKETKS